MRPEGGGGPQGAPDRPPGGDVQGAGHAALAALPPEAVGPGAWDPGVPGAPLLGTEGPVPLPYPPSPVDRYHLRRAVLLGRRGWGRVHPNPLVGCVLVKDGQGVGEGWHREFGGPHAEVEALRAAGEGARGATAYVSLEPCGHHGKTPPCALALREAGVTRVVYGAADPGVGSGGARLLREGGVQVEGPFLSPAEARRENPAFFAAQEGRGWLALKLAVSLDGRIAAAPGERTQLTGPAASAWVHRLRAGFDGILVGGWTARVDDPLLTVRGNIEPRVPPVRVVVDPAAELSPRAALLAPNLPGRVLVVTAEDTPVDRTGPLEDAGAEIVRLPGAPGGVDPLEVRRALVARGLWSLLCEGGGRLASAFLQAGAVDRVHLLVVPRVLGPRGVPAFPQGDAGPTPGGAGSVTGGAAPGPADAWTPVGPPAPLGPDVLLTYDREGRG